MRLLQKIYVSHYAIAKKTQLCQVHRTGIENLTKGIEKNFSKNETSNVCGIEDYIWGDIQLERWILEHWGETVTQATVDILQLFCDVINGVEHFNYEKVGLMAAGVGIIAFSAGDGSMALMISIAQPEFSPIGVTIAIFALDDAYKGAIITKYAYNTMPWYT